MLAWAAPCPYVREAAARLSASSAIPGQNFVGVDCGSGGIPSLDDSTCQHHKTTKTTAPTEMNTFRWYSGQIIGKQFFASGHRRSWHLAKAVCKGLVLTVAGEGRQLVSEVFSQTNIVLSEAHCHCFALLVYNIRAANPSLFRLTLRALTFGTGSRGRSKPPTEPPRRVSKPAQKLKVGGQESQPLGSGSSMTARWRDLHDRPGREAQGRTAHLR